MHRPPRKFTLSDDPFERRVYEEASKEEFSFAAAFLEETLSDMPAPVGWRRQRGRGRPRKSRPGHQEEFGWRGMAIVVVLRALADFTFREMSSYLRANPELCARLGFPRAPTAMTINRALRRFPEAWLKQLNRRLLETAKGGRPVDLQNALQVSIRQGSSSRARAVGKRSASTSAPSDATIAS